MSRMDFALGMTLTDLSSDEIDDYILIETSFDASSSPKQFGEVANDEKCEDILSLKHCFDEDSDKTAENSTNNKSCNVPKFVDYLFVEANEHTSKTNGVHPYVEDSCYNDGSIIEKLKSENRKAYLKSKNVNCIQVPKALQHEQKILPALLGSLDSSFEILNKDDAFTLSMGPKTSSNNFGLALKSSSGTDDNNSSHQRIKRTLMESKDSTKLGSDANNNIPLPLSEHHSSDISKELFLQSTTHEKQEVTVASIISKDLDDSKSKNISDITDHSAVTFDSTSLTSPEIIYCNTVTPYIFFISNLSFGLIAFFVLRLLLILWQISSSYNTSLLPSSFPSGSQRSPAISPSASTNSAIVGSHKYNTIFIHLPEASFEKDKMITENNPEISLIDHHVQKLIHRTSRFYFSSSIVLTEVRQNSKVLKMNYSNSTPNTHRLSQINYMKISSPILSPSVAADSEMTETPNTGEIDVLKHKARISLKQAGRRSINVKKNHMTLSISPGVFKSIRVIYTRSCLLWEVIDAQLMSYLANGIKGHDLGRNHFTWWALCARKIDDMVMAHNLHEKVKINKPKESAIITMNDIMNKVGIIPILCCNDSAFLVRDSDNEKETNQSKERIPRAPISILQTHPTPTKLLSSFRLRNTLIKDLDLNIPKSPRCEPYSPSPSPHIHIDVHDKKSRLPLTENELEQTVLITTPPNLPHDPLLSKYIPQPSSKFQDDIIFSCYKKELLFFTKTLSNPGHVKNRNSAHDSDQGNDTLIKQTAFAVSMSKNNKCKNSYNLCDWKASSSNDLTKSINDPDTSANSTVTFFEEAGLEQAGGSKMEWTQLSYNHPFVPEPSFLNFQRLGRILNGFNKSLFDEKFFDQTKIWDLNRKQVQLLSILFTSTAMVSITPSINSYHITHPQKPIKSVASSLAFFVNSNDRLIHNDTVLAKYTELKKKLHFERNDQNESIVRRNSSFKRAFWSSHVAVLYRNNKDQNPKQIEYDERHLHDYSLFVKSSGRVDNREFIERKRETVESAPKPRHSLSPY